jgi:hypothetical protein
MAGPNATCNNSRRAVHICFKYRNILYMLRCRVCLHLSRADALQHSESHPMASCESLGF